MAKVAAEQAASILRGAIQDHGRARLIAATGAAQSSFSRRSLVFQGSMGARLRCFTLDEYIGLPTSHPASFNRFLQERLIQKTGITRHYLLNGEGGSREGHPVRQPSAALGSH